VRIALCNEVIAPMSFPAQCEYAAKLGYDGLEIAPYTLSEEPHRIGAARIAAARAAAGGGVAASIVTPDLLLGEIELKKTSTEPEKVPVLPHPYFEANP
jgi:sugar phosphate isomerase/epimerase